MRKTHIYVEGGSSSNKALRIACESGFSKLLLNCGYKDCMPRITACGGRNQAHYRFTTAHREGSADFVALLVDSEEPVQKNKTQWQHLEERPDNRLSRPLDASDEQVFLMTTCMETWIAADPAALEKRYGGNFQTSALPAPDNLEARSKEAVFNCLVHATRKCNAQYTKGLHSFDLLGKLSPATLRNNLPSFKRMMNILNRELKSPDDKNGND